VGDGVGSSEPANERQWHVGPIQVVVGDFSVDVSSELPTLWDHFLARASFSESELDKDCLGHLFVAVRHHRIADGFPEFVVDLAYEPAGAGLRWGATLVPETGVLFLGAGERLRAYSVTPPRRRLWDDSAEFGFWSWQRADDTVVMAAESEVAAWDVAGDKLWAAPVEPPWHYRVDGDAMSVDVMGRSETFPVRSGPTKRPWRNR
jgi:hypothetical protein